MGIILYVIFLIFCIFAGFNGLPIMFIFPVITIVIIVVIALNKDSYKNVEKTSDEAKDDDIQNLIFWNMINKK